jgi:hypothetical protein
MTYPRQFHELIFSSRIYIHKMMPAAVPTFSHSFSSCLRLVRCFRSSFPDLPSRLFKRGLGTFRGFRYLVPRTVVAGLLIGGRVTIPIATARQTEQKNESENH